MNTQSCPQFQARTNDHRPPGCILSSEGAESKFCGPCKLLQFRLQNSCTKLEFLMYVPISKSVARCPDLYHLLCAENYECMTSRTTWPIWEYQVPCQPGTAAYMSICMQDMGKGYSNNNPNRKPFSFSTFNPLFDPIHFG